MLWWYCSCSSMSLVSPLRKGFPFVAYTDDGFCPLGLRMKAMKALSVLLLDNLQYRLLQALYKVS